jgi:hypothetical protein
LSKEKTTELNFVDTYYVDNGKGIKGYVGHIGRAVNTVITPLTEYFIDSVIESPTKFFDDKDDKNVIDKLKELYEEHGNNFYNFDKSRKIELLEKKKICVAVKNRFYTAQSAFPVSRH